MTSSHSVSVHKKKKRKQMGNLKKRPPIGIEGVYDENSDYRGKKTNRMEKKHKVY